MKAKDQKEARSNQEAEADLSWILQLRKTMILINRVTPPANCSADPTTVETMSSDVKLWAEVRRLPKEALTAKITNLRSQSWKHKPASIKSTRLLLVTIRLPTKISVLTIKGVGSLRCLNIVYSSFLT